MRLLLYWSSTQCHVHHLSIKTHAVPVLQHTLSWLCSWRVYFWKVTGGCGLRIVSLHWCMTTVVDLGWSRTEIKAVTGKSCVSLCVPPLPSNALFLSLFYFFFLLQHICCMFHVSVLCIISLPHVGHTLFYHFLYPFCSRKKPLLRSFHQI